MEMFYPEAFQQALSMVLTPTLFYWLAIGIFLGVGVGAMPGMSAATGIALMLPLSFFLDTAPALGLLMGLYKGAVYGGSIAAITFATPGTPGAAATTYDGYELTKQGKGRKALEMALYASITGDTLSDILTIFLAPALAIIALTFGPAERFLVAVMAFVLIGALGGKHPIKGLISASMGIFLATIGSDPVSLSPRMTFGFWWLRDGIGLIPMLIGIFAMSKMIEEVGLIAVMKKGMEKTKGAVDRITSTGPGLTIKEYLSCWKEMLIGTSIGSFAGMLPGLGATVGAFLSYSVAKQISPNRDKIGYGALEGVAAAEAGNNATVGPTLIPLLAFGIPGSASAALIGGGLALQGATPSPRMFELFPHIVYALFMILLLGNLFNLVIGRLVSRFYARLGLLPKNILVPLIMMMAIIGTYASRSNRYDVAVMLIIGLLGYCMRIAEIPSAPMVISFLLAPLMETSIRRALMISRGDWAQAFSSPLSIGLIVATVVLGFVSIWFQRKQMIG